MNQSDEWLVAIWKGNMCLQINLLCCKILKLLWLFLAPQTLPWLVLDSLKFSPKTIIPSLDEDCVTFSTFIGMILFSILKLPRSSEAMLKNSEENSHPFPISDLTKSQKSSFFTWSMILSFGLSVGRFLF